jgi:L-seryl-tRNA(Ser) seleniumtransferase
VEALARSLRSLPAVDQLLQQTAAQEYIARYGRPLTLQALRTTLEQLRSSAVTGQPLPGTPEILEQAQSLLLTWTAPSLVPVINATGVMLHTNLGRAPLSAAAIQAMQDVSLGYSNLEFDLAKGQRGSRLVHAEQLLRQLTGAQAALVVNNNAAAVLLVLTALARRRGVLIARSQLVEIGGGFRIPEVMQQSGARLVEIGATNRVHLADYETALQAAPLALVMRAHRSNFRIVGFTTEPNLAEIVRTAHAHGVPVVDDLGSGTLLDTARFGLAHEPTIAESLAAGADLVCFSGDKLLGGPQAGIILGKAELLTRLKKHPLARAVRADKLCLAALSATLAHYLKDEAELQIPIWRMISTPLEALRQRAQAWADQLGEGEVVAAQSTIGGGSLPDESLPTFALALTRRSPNRFLERMRQLTPPIIARLEKERILLDPRTVLPEQDVMMIPLIQTLLSTERKLL